MVVPLTFLVAAWFLNGVDGSAIEFEEIMEWLRVRDHERYVRLVVLAILLVGLVGVARVIKGAKKEK